MTRAAACAVASAVALFAWSAAAAPTLPEGWKAGAPEAPRKPKERSFGSHQSNHEFTFPTRPATPGDRVDVDSLPRVEITAPAAVGVAQPAAFGVAQPAAFGVDARALAALPASVGDDLVILRMRGAARLSIQNTEMGTLRVGKALPMPTGRQSEGGVPDVCGPQARARGLVPVAFESIKRIDAEGNLELTWGRAFLDADACAVSVVERHVTRLHHVASGVVFAFRTHCGACVEAHRDELHVIMPQDTRAQIDDPLPFAHHVFALGGGRSGAVEARTAFKAPLGRGGAAPRFDGGADPWSMPDWEQIIDRRCKKDTVWCTKRVRLEVSQGKGEPKPTIFLGGSL